MIDNCGCFYEYEGPEPHAPDCPTLLEHQRVLAEVTALRIIAEVPKGWGFDGKLSWSDPAPSRPTEPNDG